MKHCAHSVRKKTSRTLSIVTQRNAYQF